MNIAGKKILITGGNGFIGSRVTHYLKQSGVKNIYTPGSKECNLLNQHDIQKLFQNYKPDIVIHLAAKVGGIEAIRSAPGTYYYENLIMGAYLLEQCRLNKINKIVVIGTNCSYPEKAEVPFKEGSFLDGYPQSVNAPYGIAKRALYQQCLSYHKQYGLEFAYLIPTNTYGIGDHFDESTGHVIPSMIKKFLSAVNNREKAVVLWGTGNSTREFMYIDDTAKAIIKAADIYNDTSPLNIGTGCEISIKELAGKIAGITGYKGEIIWDTSKPDGYKRKCLDIEKMKKVLSFECTVTIDDGLNRTISWVKNQK